MGKDISATHWSHTAFGRGKNKLCAFLGVLVWSQQQA